MADHSIMLGETASLDAGKLEAALVWDVLGVEEFAVQLSRTGYDWPSGAVLTLEVSQSGQDWAAPPAAAVTYSALGFQASVWVKPVRFVRLRVSAKAAAEGTNVEVCGYGE